MEQSILNEILDNHYYDYFKIAIKLFYNGNKEYIRYIRLIPKHIFPEVIKLHNNYRAKFKRVHRRIRSIVSAPSCFLTLTFKDEVLIKTSPRTRRTYISRFLNSLNCDYLGNIDYGKQNNREHYHAVVQVKEVDLSTYPYGFIFSEKIRCKEDSLRLSRYIKKLTFHALKTNNDRILTARGEKYKLELICDFNQADYYDKDFINEYNIFKEI